MLSLKMQITVAADDIFILFLVFFRKNKGYISCKSSAYQRIHMKYQIGDIFSEKYEKKKKKKRKRKWNVARYNFA